MGESELSSVTLTVVSNSNFDSFFFFGSAQSILLFLRFVMNAKL